MAAPPEFQSVQKTVLVVDDDPATLKFISELLANGSYNVLTAENGLDAIQQSKDFTSDIHLLLSDFQMAGLSGIDVATAITIQRPNIKVLLMSGFAAGMLVLNEGWHFLAKPFIPSQLRGLIMGLVSPDKESKL
jgi:CheY-like chemotaxis protein